MERRAIQVRGIVQGVGFRPFVHSLASRLGLAGFVRNQVGSVQIEVEGPAAALDQFLGELQSEAPTLSRIEDVSWLPIPSLGERKFQIKSSDGAAAAQVFVSPDAATCPDCLAELFDPSDRRYRHPFINCTNCGPRLTVIQGAPYDRERTTMGRFAMCAACRAEYEDPAGRRFHAQPIACRDCGPRLELLRSDGQPAGPGDPIVQFAAAILRGQIGALKGVGGFHLVCNAADQRAVGELRRRKHRDEKPFAIMVRDVVAAAALCEIGPAERSLLESWRRPIVLLRKRGGDAVALVSEAVAPGNPSLGVVLPYTPLHHLLLAAVGEIPLVMTSGNRSDEPIAYLNADARERLAGIADIFLLHDRDIHVRCDDSVTRIVPQQAGAGQELPLRRSRGYAPQPIRLPLDCPRPVLAVGGQFKGTFALGRERQAFISHHMGDLDHLDAYRAFERDIRLYEELFEMRPAAIVHDLHPDYMSTQYALRRATDEGIRRLAVQHHHAHLASCMAEHGLDEPMIGVTFDGTGFGPEEQMAGQTAGQSGGEPTIWGGEFLVGDYRGFHRAAHLRPVGMPGGDKAAREPWRMAASHLIDAGGDLSALAARIPAAELRAVRSMLARRFRTPLTSSAGRLFDAVASIAGVRDRASYEGQAAMQLEWLASELPAESSYHFDIEATAASATGNQPPPMVIDTRPLIRAVADDAARGVAANRIARQFHSTMAEVIGAVCERIRGRAGLSAVALSGGVFMNALLTAEAERRLSAARFRVYRHRLVPPNDGGLCLGQIAIAAAALAVADGKSEE